MVRNRIQVGILKRLRDQASSLWVVAVRDNLLGNNVLVKRIVEVDLDCNITWEVELGV